MYGNGVNNNNQGGGNQKYRNFIDMKDCVTKDGNQFIGVTTIVWVKNPKVGTTAGGKKYASAQVALNNCGNALKFALGPDVEARDDAVWATVSIWDNGHNEVDYFMSRFNGFERRRMVITGSIRLREGKHQDGTPGHFVGINIDRYACVDGYKQAGAATGTQAASAPVSAPAPAAGVAPQGDFVSDLDDSDGDVPF